MDFCVRSFICHTFTGFSIFAHALDTEGRNEHAKQGGQKVIAGAEGTGEKDKAGHRKIPLGETVVVGTDTTEFGIINSLSRSLRKAAPRSYL
jgi:hypothetical protein